MELRLSAREQALLGETQDVLLSPFAFDTLEEWRACALRHLREVVSADRGLFLMSGVDQLLANGDGFSTAEREQYEAVFPNDPGREVVRSKGLEIWNHAGLIQPNPEFFYKSWFYHDYYRPLGLEDGIGYLVESGDYRDFALVKLHHSQPGTPNFGDRGRAMLQLLLPAFKAGVRSCNRSPVSGALTAMVDAMPDGIELHDDLGRSLHRNSVLQRLLSADPQRELIESEMRYVRLSAHEHTKSPHAAGQPYSRLLITPHDRYEIWVARVRERSSGARSIVAVFVRPSGITVAMIVSAARSFLLSTREREVLALLVRGATAKEIAAALHVRVNTARRHTESVLRKTGAHSRTALGAIVRAAHRRGA